MNVVQSSFNDIDHLTTVLQTEKTSNHNSFNGINVELLSIRSISDASSNQYDINLVLFGQSFNETTTWLIFLPKLVSMSICGIYRTEDFDLIWGDNR